MLLACGGPSIFAVSLGAGGDVHRAVRIDLARNDAIFSIRRRAIAVAVEREDLAFLYLDSLDLVTRGNFARLALVAAVYLGQALGDPVVIRERQAQLGPQNLAIVLSFPSRIAIGRRSREIIAR